MNLSDKPYVVELFDGRVIIFKNIGEFLNSEHNTADWLMRSYAEFYSEPPQSSLMDVDDEIGEDPAKYIQGS